MCAAGFRTGVFRQLQFGHSCSGGAGWSDTACSWSRNAVWWGPWLCQTLTALLSKLAALLFSFFELVNQPFFVLLQIFHLISHTHQHDNENHDDDCCCTTKEHPSGEAIPVTGDEHVLVSVHRTRFVVSLDCVSHRKTFATDQSFALEVPPFARHTFFALHPATSLEHPVGWSSFLGFFGAHVSRMQAPVTT